MTESVLRRQFSINSKQQSPYWPTNYTDDWLINQQFNSTSSNLSYEDSAANPPKTYSLLHLLVLVLSTYFIPVIIGVGIVGNGLALVVFLGTYLKRLSLSVYLAALAVSDAVFLLTLFILWLEYVNVPIFHRNGWCQGAIFLSYCSSFLSVWFVVSFTVERYIAICHPLKRPELCTTSRAKCVVVALTLFSLMGYSCTLWTSGVVVVAGKTEKHRTCTPLKDYLQIHTVLTYIDTIVTLIIPFLLIIGLNITIAHRIAYFYQRRQTVQGSPKGNQSLCSRAQLKVTKMLLLLSSLFLLINLPSYAMRMRIIIMSVLDRTDEISHQEMLLQQLFQIVYYSNFAINFVLYSLCSAKFREAFARFWWQMKYKSVRLTANLYRALRKDDSSSAEPDYPTILQLRHVGNMNQKLCMYD